MRQCLQCDSYSPDYSQYCRNCGSSLTVGHTANRAATTQAPGQPPTVVRRRKNRVFIPGLGVFGFLKRDPQTGQWGCGPGFLITAVLAAVVAVGGFLLLQHSASVANLSFSGTVVPGGSIQVHGSNFPPRSTVVIYVDGAPSASRSMSVAASIGDLFILERQTHPSDHTVIVGSGGTFDTTIPVPSSWVPGSHHTIRATTQNAQASTQASVDVETQSSNPTSTVPPTVVPPTPPTVVPPTPPCKLSLSTSSLDLGSVQQDQPASGQVTVGNTGGQALTWNGDTGSAGWVKLDQSSGTLQPGSQQAVTVTADTSQAGTYSTNLNFSSSCGGGQVSVTLVVTPPTQSPVMQLSMTSLTFNAGCNSSLAQSINVTNAGGGTLTWTVGTPSDSWLIVSPGSGSNVAGVSSPLIFAVPPNSLPNNTYTATVDITSNGGTQTVTVTLNVQC